VALEARSLDTKRASQSDVAHKACIEARECKTCREDRASRNRVASGPDDAQFTNAKFSKAPAVSPNNDVKYDTNKRRAHTFAASTNAAVTYAVAKDTPSQDALREKPGLAAEKMKWLQRHDRESGDLYGVLPLIHNMPMALADHIDRSEDKQLLRGKLCYLHSWVLDDKEESEFQGNSRVLQKLPVVVYVKFPGATWTLPGLKEKGVYPIKPKNGVWYVDRGRKHPVLRITRRQLPLVPAFAITAHASQGQTLDAAIVDLQIGKGTSPIASYVALTRVRSRGDLLIYRPFDRLLFNQGSLEGPELLLRVLRGEDIDWASIEEKHTPKRLCLGCGFVRFKDTFLPGQWNRKDERRFCKACVEQKTKEGTPYECLTCHFWKAGEAFSDEQRSKYVHRHCMDCVEKRKCIECEQLLPETKFTHNEWKMGLQAGRQGRCKDCMKHHKETKSCCKCDKLFDVDGFGEWQWEKSIMRGRLGPSSRS